MKKIIRFLILATIFFPKLSLSCSCIGTETFCETIIGSTTGEIRPELILRGEIIKSDIERNKRIKINELIFGDFNDSEIELNYDLCSIYFSELEIGNEYLIALNRFDDFSSLISEGTGFLKMENKGFKEKIQHVMKPLTNYI